MRVCNSGWGGGGQDCCFGLVVASRTFHDSIGNVCLCTFSSGLEYLLRDFVGKRLAIGVVLRYASCKLANIPGFGSKVPLCCVFKENGSLRKLGHRGFITFLVVDWVCYRLVTVREGVRIEKTLY